MGATLIYALGESRKLSREQKVLELTDYFVGVCEEADASSRNASGSDCYYAAILENLVGHFLRGEAGFEMHEKLDPAAISELYAEIATRAENYSPPRPVLPRATLDKLRQDMKNTIR